MNPQTDADYDIADQFDRDCERDQGWHRGTVARPRPVADERVATALAGLSRLQRRDKSIRIGDAKLRRALEALEAGTPDWLERKREVIARIEELCDDARDSKYSMLARFIKADAAMSIGRVAYRPQACAVIDELFPDALKWTWSSPEFLQIERAMPSVYRRFFEGAGALYAGNGEPEKAMAAFDKLYEMDSAGDPKFRPHVSVVNCATKVARTIKREDWVASMWRRWDTDHRPMQDPQLDEELSNRFRTTPAYALEIMAARAERERKKAEREQLQAGTANKGRRRNGSGTEEMR